ncbi:MAG: hypothetical protein IJV36_07090 [Prevotella sp.]|nr:hypothetical protein [Prevotella sp.]
MKRFCFALIFLLAAHHIVAQQYPLEWKNFTSSEYLYDIQSDENVKNLTATDFKELLLNVARANLAKQVQTSIHDNATLNKATVDGHTSISYQTETFYLTDIELQLVTTQTAYYPESRIGHAIAYIEKSQARQYYVNMLQSHYDKINYTIIEAEDLIAKGFKSKAKSLLEHSLGIFKDKENPFFWLNVFELSPSELVAWQQKIADREQTVKRMIADLDHGTGVFLTCRADNFGVPYPMLQNELKGIIAQNDCNITENGESADFKIKITCEARKGNHVNLSGASCYFAFVDATITIDKVATSQRIYENAITVKGAHTSNFKEAAKIAYRDLKKELGAIINENIK